MALVIFLSLMMLSAIYAVRDAFRSTDLPKATPPQEPATTSPFPREVNARVRGKVSVTPPAPPAEPAVAPVNSLPAPLAPSVTASPRTLKLSK
jgi:hypothetical protein